MNREAIEELVRRGAVRDGDLVIITKGDLMGVHGGTNAMKIITRGRTRILEVLLPASAGQADARHGIS